MLAIALANANIQNLKNISCKTLQ